MDRLDNGLLDFGVVIEPVDLKKYDFQKLPATDTWGLLMRKDSPLAAKEVIRPEDILNIPLLCSNQTLVKNELSGWAGIDFIWKKYQVFSKASKIFLKKLQEEITKP